MTQPSGALAGDTRLSSVQRTILRRRTLPDGRAVAGGLLVTIAAVGAFALAEQEPADPRRDVVIATRDIEPGERLESADLALEPMALSRTIWECSWP